MVAMTFVFAFAIQVHYLGEKEGFHGDEVWSFSISEYNDYGWLQNPPAGEYSGAELKQIILAPNPSVSDAAKDVFHLWRNNRDSPHTNFYYSLLRISTIGVEATDADNLKDQLIFRAGALNLIFFTIAFVVLFFLLSYLIDKKELIILGLVAAFVNPVYISNTLFFRPYALQTLMVILFTAYIIFVHSRIKLNKYVDSWENLVLFSFILSLLLLTGYYGYIYVSILAAGFFLFTLVRYRRLDLMPYFIIGCIFGLSLDFLFYDNYSAAFFGGRTINTINGSNIYSGSFIDTFTFIKDGLLYYPTIFLLLIITVYKLLKKESFDILKEYGWIIVAALLSCVVTIYVAPFKIIRYISPYFTLISLLIPFVLVSLNNRAIMRSVSGIICTILVLVALKGDKIQYRYKTEELQKYPHNIAAMGMDTSLPVYFYAGTMQVGQVLTQLNNEQRFILCDSFDSLLEQSLGKDCFVFVNNYIDLTEYNYEVIHESPYSTTYRFVR